MEIFNKQEWTIIILIAIHILLQGVKTIFPVETIYPCIERLPGQPRKVPKCCKRYPSHPDMKKEQEKIFPSFFHCKDRVDFAFGRCGQHICPRQLGEQCSGTFGSYGLCDPVWLRCKCMNCTEINKQTGQVKCVEFTDDSIRQDLRTCSGHCVPPHLFQNNTEHLYFARDTSGYQAYRVEMISTCWDPNKATACELLEKGEVDDFALRPCNGTCEFTYSTDVKHITCHDTGGDSVSTVDPAGCAQTGNNSATPSNNSATPSNSFSGKRGYFILIMIIVCQNQMLYSSKYYT